MARHVRRRERTALAAVGPSEEVPRQQAEPDDHQADDDRSPAGDGEDVPPPGHEQDDPAEEEDHAADPVGEEGEARGGRRPEPPEAHPDRQRKADGDEQHQLDRPGVHGGLHSEHAVHDPDHDGNDDDRGGRRHDLEADDVAGGGAQRVPLLGPGRQHRRDRESQQRGAHPLPEIEQPDDEEHEGRLQDEHRGQGRDAEVRAAKEQQRIVRPGPEADRQHEQHDAEDQDELQDGGRIHDRSPGGDPGSVGARGFGAVS